MEQSNVFVFDGFQIERESYLGGDCYGVVTSCKKDGAGIPYHLEVEFDISKARFSFSKCYPHEVVPYRVGCICSVSCLPYMQMLSSVSAKACCLMHTVAADCSLWSTDVNGANGGFSAFLSNFKVVGI